ncbi:hypothetical protein ABPG75_001186 [Micractinium tetrahymenae]
MVSRGLRLRVECVGGERPLPPQLRQELRQRNEAVMRNRLEQRRQQWSQWEEQVAREEADRRERRTEQQGLAARAPVVPAARPPPPPSQALPAQSWEQQKAVQSPVRRPLPVPPRLRPEQRQAFVAASQEVEQQLQAREQQLAEVQASAANWFVLLAFASLEQRIAQRRRQAGRWMGASGLQRKVARFGELVNSLRRNQEMRGAGASWGRSDDQLRGAAYPGSAGGASASSSSTASGVSGWEQALNVTRVQRRGGAPRTRATPLEEQQAQAQAQQQQQAQLGPTPAQVAWQQGQGWEPGSSEPSAGQQQQPQQQAVWQAGLPSSGPGYGARPNADDGGLDW